MPIFTNRLAQETSPYLLQHAHNPVNWFPWGPEALEKARKEDLPILVSIGYSACHWCHVMEHESFEDEQTAALMNEKFVCIKIDREERPDLDHIYMDAVQTMTGSGGWPLNVFLTPDAKPFYGGTYFPPKPAFNRPSWTDVLAGISASFHEKRREIVAQSEKLTNHLVQSNAFGIDRKTGSEDDYSQVFIQENLERIRDHLMQSADTEYGGFGKAPKFPQTFCIRYLLHYYYFSKDQTALDQACLSLDKMISGGIYDQIGGGFSRYSTDTEWLAPHFEKMLYDNALLVIVMSEAYQLTKKESYRNTIIQTMAFIERELSDPSGGFYAALDADSEGEEGKYYVWTKKEIENILGGEAPLFCAFYDVSEDGNWEGKNILRMNIDVSEFSRRNTIPEHELIARLGRSRQKLLEQRQRRVAPALDDKMLLAWNALMNTACCKAYGALGMPAYRERAVKNMDFMLQHFKGDSAHAFHHSYKNGVARFPAFLDDYAFLIAALIDLQEVTGQTNYLLKAKEVTEYVENFFSEPDTGFFFYTHQDQKDVIIRKKEIYDGAIPSGNAVMNFNLLYLSVIFNRPEWKSRSAKTCFAVHETIIKYPASFGVWATLFQAFTLGITELVVTGRNLETVGREILSIPLPYRVYQSASSENHDFILLSGKPVEDEPLIFLCRDYSCQMPVTEISALAGLMGNVHKFNVKT